MPTLTDLTTGVQTVTATGALTPTAGVSISGISGDFTVCMEVIELTAGKTCRVQIEDSTNAFTASNALWVEDFTGQVGENVAYSTGFAQGDYNPTTDKRTIRKYQRPNNLFGTASAVLRANVTVIDSSASISIHCWIES